MFSWSSGKGWEDFDRTIKTCWRCHGYKYNTAIHVTEKDLSANKICFACL